MNVNLTKLHFLPFVMLYRMRMCQNDASSFSL
nr:MAG TPA: hypothetical protein [Caudoviricetes sp.]